MKSNLRCINDLFLSVLPGLRVKKMQSNLSHVLISVQSSETAFLANDPPNQS